MRLPDIAPSELGKDGERYVLLTFAGTRTKALELSIDGDPGFRAEKISESGLAWALRIGGPQPQKLEGRISYLGERPRSPRLLALQLPTQVDDPDSFPPQVAEEARRFRDQTRLEQIRSRLDAAEHDTDPQRGKDRLRCLRFDAATSAAYLEVLLDTTSALPSDVQQLIGALQLDVGLAMSMANVKEDLLERCEMRAKNFARGTYRLALPEMRDDYLAVARYLRQVLGGPHWSHGLSGAFDLAELEPWLLRFANGDLSFLALPSAPDGTDAPGEADEELDWSLNAEPDGLLFATLPEFLLAVACLHEGEERKSWFDAYVVSLRAFEVMLARYAPAIGPREWSGFDCELMHRARTPPVAEEQLALVRKRLPLPREALAVELAEPQATSLGNGYVNHLLSLHGALLWSALRDHPTVKLSTAAPPSATDPGAFTLEALAASLKPAPP